MAAGRGPRPSALAHGVRAVDERGSVLAVVAICLFLFLALAAVAVDLGLAMGARTAAQRVADAAAHAGAGGLIVSPDNDATARALAIDYAARNRILGTPAVVLPSDVYVDLTADSVRVTVHRTTARSNPIQTIFARTLGIASVDVITTATAQLFPAGGARCLLPLALPDRWAEGDGAGSWWWPTASDTYDPSTDRYQEWTEGDGLSAPAPTAPTGYDEAAIGQEIVIKQNGGGGTVNSSWYYPWRPPGQQGGDDYRANIESCTNQTDITYFTGQSVDTEPGSMNGPTTQGFQTIIQSDPNVQWDATDNCAKRYDLSGATTECLVGGTQPTATTTPRIRPVAMFDPTQPVDPGVEPLVFSNFAALFIESVTASAVTARFQGYSGVGAVTEGSGTLSKVIKIIH